MGHLVSTYLRGECVDGLTAAALALHPNVIFQVTEDTATGIQHLEQTEHVAAGTLSLVIQSYPPAPFIGPLKCGPREVQIRDHPLCTAAFEPFRGIHNRRPPPDPAVEAVLLLYQSLALDQDRRPAQTHKVLPPMNRWIAQWVADTTVEGRHKLDRHARRRLVDDLTKPTDLLSDAECVRKRDDEVARLRDAMLQQAGPIMGAIHARVPRITERLLDAMTTPDTTVYTDPHRPLSPPPDVIQTASRIRVSWEKGAKKGMPECQHTDEPGSRPEPGSDPATPNRKGSEEGEAAPAVEDDGNMVRPVVDELKIELDMSEATILRTADAVFEVLEGCVVYEAILPFSPTHLASLCARVLYRINFHVKEPQMRVALLFLLFDALFLGLTVRTPGLAGMCVDAKMRALAESKVGGLREVLAALAADLAAIDLCLLKLTSKHMQETLAAPNPAILHRLAHIQGQCHMPHCHTPLVGPEGHLHASTTWETTVSLQANAFGADETNVLADGMPAFPALGGIYALVQHEYASEVASALARHVQLVHVKETGPPHFSHAAVAAFEALMLRQDDFHDAPEFCEPSTLNCRVYRCAA